VYEVHKDLVRNAFSDIINIFKYLGVSVLFAEEIFLIKFNLQYVDIILFLFYLIEKL